VRVPRLFHTEALPAVWQMTSDVEARTRAGCSLADVFAALFPCGSITGAPKVRRHAGDPRAGARGRAACTAAPSAWCARRRGDLQRADPHGDLRGQEARCGIGSGITADAQADAEWDEWRHKRAFLGQATRPAEPALDLLETLALVDGELRDAPAHLARMASAAAHFGRMWNEAPVVACLDRLKEQRVTGMWRVRLLLDVHGEPRAEAFTMEAPPARVKLQLASHAFDEAHSDFTRFKTTRRAHYDAFAPTEPGVFDTLLWNPRGELTECTRGNIALRLDGRWVTPPLRCGLLGGIGRARRLHSGELAEAVVRVDDLPRVQALAFVNSLRGWIDADLHVPSK
jgi:para-aminobenzoate synthetase/4-amino-4-deoxychorismate lyase